MVVLRSREVVSSADQKPKPDFKTPTKRKAPEPSTPARAREPARVRMETPPEPPKPRRSLRLSSVVGTPAPRKRRKGNEEGGDGNDSGLGFSEEDVVMNLIDSVGKSESGKDDEGEAVVVGEEEEEARVLDLIGSVGGDSKGKVVMEVEEDTHGVGGSVGWDTKGKGILKVKKEDIDWAGVSVVGDRKGKGVLEVEEEEEDTDWFSGSVGRNRKGKGILEVEEEDTHRVGGGAEQEGEDYLDENYLEGRREHMKSYSRNLRKRIFRNVAKRRASAFAHFEQEQVHVDVEGDAQDPPLQEEEEAENMVEDWPGPFSTALKIIRDRANKANIPRRAGTCEKGKFGAVVWEPKERICNRRPRVSVPSLQDICLSTLAKNAEAIVSLEGVPDPLRLRLSSMLCDSRRMSKHFLDLLVQGSPTEIRMKDCSWLAEEDFTKCFQECNTNNLTLLLVLRIGLVCKNESEVGRIQQLYQLKSKHILSSSAFDLLYIVLPKQVLQLDQCGRCIADYTILPTIAQSPRSLPVLTTLSLAGACRLSDAALKSLVSATPALRSINLSQCSLLTSASIDTMSNSLGSVLRELYIDDCLGLDPKLILPALKKIEHLEVLSLAGIETISDVFIKGLVIARGNNMKELVLSNCVELTDSSLKEIAATCTRLRSLDLVNLRKLTDAALGYLANGCQEIQKFKLCRNAFSDEAVAAFLETSGKILEELSLNNVNKVGVNTSLALAKCGRCLSSLDLSWCRSLTDEAMGLIVDNCLSLRVLKLFGCTQITSTFVDGHSNPDVQIIGLAMSPTLLIRKPEQQDYVLRYSAV